MRRQDSFIFFLQTEPPALLPVLLARAKAWHQDMAQQKKTQMDPDQYIPLRVKLFQDMAAMLHDRVTKLSKAAATDSLWTTALEHGVITETGSFRFQRWNSQQKALTLTHKEHVPMTRMLKYIDQMQEVARDHTAVVKFHSLRPAEQQTTVPWIMQVGMRHDEMQLMLESLSGSTVWGLLGASMKPHSQAQSKQSQQLQVLLGKGKGKTTGKQAPAKGKGKKAT